MPVPGQELERPSSKKSPALLEIPGEESPANNIEPPQPSLTKPAPFSQAPRVQGLTVYSKNQLDAILKTCGAKNDALSPLRSCAEALTAKLVSDGYINSIVYEQLKPDPGFLLVDEGKIVEVRVECSDPRLRKSVLSLLKSLHGSILNTLSLRRSLERLRAVEGIAFVKGSLGRLGSDPSQASLTVYVQPDRGALRGELGLRNDGSIGSGEFRTTGVLLKNSFIQSGDSLLIYGELDADSQPNLGSAIGSVSYSLPLSDRFTVTGAFGFSRRNLIELPQPSNGISSSQYQGYGQMEYLIKQSLYQRWAFTAGLSALTNNIYLNGQSALQFLPSRLARPQSGYMRFALTGNGTAGKADWLATSYFLQGIGGATPQEQRVDLSSIGINPSQSSALGALVSATLNISPRSQVNLRAGGQLALQPLTSPMQFTIGSDVGLRGLPGQLISGDNGWLGVGEIAYMVWRNKNQGVQIVPFIGAGGVKTSVAGATFADTVGSGGLLFRWMASSGWAFELGWVKQFNIETPSEIWNSWLIGDGLYTKATFRF